MNDRGYDDRPVQSLTAAELLEQAEQSDFDSGYYAGVLNSGASRQEYEPLLTTARERRAECFSELARRLEAAEAEASELTTLVQKANRLVLRIENWDGGDDYYILRDCHDLRTALRPFQQEASETLEVQAADPWEDDDDWQSFCPKCGLLKIGHKGDTCPQTDQEAMDNALNRQGAPDGS